jgi:hypothetical protein
MRHVVDHAGGRALGVAMGRTLRWARGEELDTSGAYATYYLIGTLAPGETLTRSILTMELLWTDAGTPYTWAGVGVAYGLWVQPGNSLPAITPIGNVGSTNPRWLWWDSPIWVEGQPSPGSPSTTYVARNTEPSTYIDCKSQWRNDTAVNQYVWWGIEVPPVPPISGPTMYASLTYNLAILEAS